jgi:hypothetical protein
LVLRVTRSKRCLLTTRAITGFLDFWSPANCSTFTTARCRSGSTRSKSASTRSESGWRLNIERLGSACREGGQCLAEHPSAGTSGPHGRTQINQPLGLTVYCCRVRLDPARESKCPGSQVWRDSLRPRRLRRCWPRAWAAARRCPTSRAP